MMTSITIKLYLYLTYIIYFLLVPIGFCFRNSTLNKRLLLFKIIPTTNKNTIWIHGASVGEILSTYTLVSKLKKNYPNYNIIITSHTVTSKHIVNTKFVALAKHYYLPFDCPYLIKKFIKQHNIKLVLWLEQDFMPATLYTINNKQIPLLLLNARMSTKSFANWYKIKPFTITLLKNFNLILPMTIKNYKYLKRFSQHVKFVGNLKYTNTKFNLNKDLIKELENFFPTQQIFVALSTHDDEEKNIAKVHTELVKQYPKLTTIIIPRHPQRCKIIYKQLKKTHPQITIYKRGIQNTSNLYLVNSIGEVKEFCSMALITFVGKSLSTKQQGGHNPLEPVLLKSCTIFGPFMQNFTDIVNEILKYKAGLQVNSFEELQEKLKILLQQKDEFFTIIHNTNKLNTYSEEILNKYLKEIQCYL